jgi:hypothetical protein
MDSEGPPLPVMNDAEQQERPSGRVQRRQTLWLDRLAALIAATAMVLCFRGRGHHGTWILLSFAAPALGFVLSAAYRRRVLGWLKALWSQVACYAEGGGPTPWLGTFVFAVVPAALLYLSNNRTMGSGDTVPVMLTAASLVAEGNWDLSEYFGTGVRWPYSRENELPYYVRPDSGRVYSNYPSGMVSFALPIAVVSRLAGADFGLPKTHQRLEKWTASWLAAVSIGVFFLLALELAKPAPALTATMILCAASAMFSTVGQGLWQHGGVIFWSLVVLLLEFRQHKRESALTTAAQGVGCAIMLACRLSALVFVVPFAIWLMLRSLRRTLLCLGVACLAAMPWIALNWTIYGDVLGTTRAQIGSDCWSADVAGSLVGVLFSPARGVFVYQPWLILVFAGCIPALRRQEPHSAQKPTPRGWQWVCIWAIVLQIVLASAWRMWWGGHCWGSRLAADVLPLWALLCVPPIAALWARKGGRALLVVLAILGCLAHIPAVYFQADRWNADPVNVDERPDRLWSWREVPFLYPQRR